MQVNMNEIVGKSDILFLTLDTLRYDVAEQEYLAGNLPNLCADSGWEKRHSPGDYTYSSHHSFFAGFLPTPSEYVPLNEREYLFSMKNSMLKYKNHGNIYYFDAPNIVKAMEKEGYKTVCIGGVIFFNKSNELCSVLPNMFAESYWNPKFGVTNPKSVEYQVKQALKVLKSLEKDEKIFLFLNLSAIHGPNYYYLEEYKNKMDEYDPGKNVLASKYDGTESQAAALRYVDKCLEPLFEYMRERNKTFCIALSDHGTCYGEDGFEGHNLAHEAVWTVPYKHFFL